MYQNFEFLRFSLNEIKYSEHSKKDKLTLDEKIKKLSEKIFFCKK